jgi:hypothetical protein
VRAGFLSHCGWGRASAILDSLERRHRLFRVALLGIDRWVGGTHLRPGHVPRWDGASRRLVPDG